MDDQRGTVGVVLPADENRRLLVDRLTTAGYAVEAAGTAADLPTDVDCVLVGSRLFEAAADALRERRAAAPTYLPVLLVVADRRASARRDASDPLAGLPPSLADLVDDAVTAPIRGAALVRRVDGLVRARRLSVRLQESRDRYRRLVEVLPEAVLLLSEGTIRYCNRAADALLAGTNEDEGGGGDGGEDVNGEEDGDERGNGEKDGREQGNGEEDGDATQPVPGSGPDAGARVDADADGSLPAALGGGSTGSALVGRSFDAVVPPGERAAVTELLGRRDGTFADATLETLDGRTVLAEVAATRVASGGTDLTQVVVRDVTERRDREEQLRLFRRAMEEASVGVTITDPTRPDNPIVYANDEFVRLTGRDREWLRGRNPRFVQTDDTDPATVAELRRAIDAEEPVSVELLNRRAGGREWYNALDVTPVRDETGAVTHFLGFQRDVTERKRRAATFRALHAATNRLQGATNVDATFEVAVDIARTVLELPVTACWRDDDGTLRPVAGTDAAWAAGLPTFDADDNDYGSVATTGSESVDVVTNSDGGPIGCGLYVPLGDYGLLGAAEPDRTSYPDYVRDAAEMLADHVTAALDRADREEALRERERELERYETILGAAGDPIYTLDDEGRFTDVNDAMVEFTGYDRDRLRGTHISLLLDTADIEHCEERIADLVHDGTDADATAEVTVETATGEARACEVNIALLPESDGGGFGGSVGVLRDITDRERRRQRVAVLDRVLRHNLRNEVNVIHGRAQHLDAGDDLPADAGHDVVAIAEASERLLDVAEKARAFHRSLSSPRRERDLLDVVEAVVARFGDAAAARSVQVAVRVDADPGSGSGSGSDSASTPEPGTDSGRPPDGRSGQAVDGRGRARPTVVADDGLELALAELVENAVENAPHGSTVEVRVRTVDATASADGDADSGSPDWVDVEVHDDGDGIPPAERAALDGTVETALSHGSGIGLWLVAWTANRVGGRVTYDDGGSTVGLRLRPGRD